MTFRIPFSSTRACPDRFARVQGARSRSDTRPLG
jgi:hypothetical protein